MRVGGWPEERVPEGVDEEHASELHEDPDRSDGDHLRLRHVEETEAVGGDVEDHAGPDHVSGALEQEGERKRGRDREQGRKQRDDGRVCDEQVQVDRAEDPERDQPGAPERMARLAEVAEDEAAEQCLLGDAVQRDRAGEDPEPVRAQAQGRACERRVDREERQQADRDDRSGGDRTGGRAAEAEGGEAGADAAAEGEPLDRRPRGRAFPR